MDMFIAFRLSDDKKDETSNRILRVRLLDDEARTG